MCTHVGASVRCSIILTFFLIIHIFWTEVMKERDFIKIQDSLSVFYGFLFELWGQYFKVCSGWKALCSDNRTWFMWQYIFSIGGLLTTLVITGIIHCQQTKNLHLNYCLSCLWFLNCSGRIDYFLCPGLSKSWVQWAVSTWVIPFQLSIWHVLIDSGSNILQTIVSF